MIEKKDHLYSDKTNDQPQKGGYKSNTEKILIRSGAPPASRGNQIELFSDGSLAYFRLMELLEKAEHSIDITTFILGHDDVGKSIIETLTRKARQGLKIRLILDSLGCLRTRGRFVDPLREAGGKVGIFMPMLPFHRKWSAHLRNHRKIIIVDQASAIVGGMNLAVTYMGSDSNKSRWNDFGVLVKGPLVSDICQIFNADWAFATGGEYKMDTQSANSFIPFQKMEAGISSQVVASGPDVPTDSFSEAILTAILEAKKRVWIVTPYFIPDEPLLKSLSLLARWGKDVRIITPKRSNHLLADLARGSYLRTLAEAGVNIFYFYEGMLHSKIIIIDHSIAIVGSANMDMRSLYLNYEIALFIYSTKQTYAIEKIIMEELLPKTKVMEYGTYSLKRGIIEWMEDISRVFSPFL
jgi:cardiolipin synthase